MAFVKDYQIFAIFRKTHKEPLGSVVQVGTKHNLIYRVIKTSETNFHVELATTSGKQVFGALGFRNKQEAVEWAKTRSPYQDHL